MPATPQSLTSPVAEAAHAHDERLPSFSNPQQAQASRLGEPVEVEPEYISKIGILASSMPYYHNQYMAKRKAEQQRAITEPEEMEPHELEYFSKLSTDTNPQEQSKEDQAATARRLKPHSRSTVQLQNITSQQPEGLTQITAKKSKVPRWQFGIRSRNLPFEAMLCIYKALSAQKAQWQVSAPPGNEPRKPPGPYPVRVAGATHLTSTNRHNSDKHAHSPEQHHQLDDSTPNYGSDGAIENDNPDSSGTSTLTRQDSDEGIDPNVIPEGYIPKDPWCIHVRWRKDGMYPPGTVHPGSAHSSRVDLTNDDQARRRSSIIGSLSSATGSTSSVAATTITTGLQPLAMADSACYVYMDVQLYTLEAETYLVDFKCAGYEPIIEVAVSETEKKLVGSGFRVLDKDVTSPQPFLDLTNKLVIHLASGA